MATVRKVHTRLDKQMGCSKAYTSCNNGVGARGYSLAEVAICLTILSLIITGIFSIQAQKGENNLYALTLKRLDVIQQALDRFIIENQYIPCPSSGDAIESDDNFGMDDRDSTDDGLCNITNPDLGDDTGMVPVRSLGLADEYAYDGWDRKFVYRVATGMNKGTNAVNPSVNFAREQYRGDIQIVDLAGVPLTEINNAPPNNYGAAYVIISYGADGKGLTWAKGERLAIRKQATGRSYENTNHQIDKIYIKDRYSSEFDDIVVFRSKKDLISNVSNPNMWLPATACTNAHALALHPLSEEQNGPNIGRPAAFPNAPLPPVAGDVSASLASKINIAARVIDNICQHPPADMCQFSPEQLSSTGLIVWLDGNDPNGDGGEPEVGALNSWANKANPLNNATANTAPNIVHDNDKCGRNKYCVEFSSASQQSLSLELSALANKNYTIFAVVRPNNLNRRNFILSSANYGLSSNSSIMWGHFGSEGYVVDQYGASAVSPSFEQGESERVILVASLNPNDAQEDGLHIWAYNKDGYMVTGEDLLSASQLTQVSGGLVGALHNSLSATYVTTGNNYSDMALQELLVYDVPLTNANRMQVVSYLMKKWFYGICN